MAMINWLDNPDASYVLAAYGLAAACLVLLLVLSISEARHAQRAWKTVAARSSAKDLQ